MLSNAYRSYYIYLLDHGWDEPFGEAVRTNLPRMADLASKSDAVVVHGPRGVHFEDEVLSWHNVNGAPGGEMLPALLLTTRNPHTFREVYGPASHRAPEDALVLIPLRRVCETPNDVLRVIDHLFRDISGGKRLTDFEIVNELRGGVGRAIVNALILQPNASGFGIDLKKLAEFFENPLTRRR